MGAGAKRETPDGMTPSAPADMVTSAGAFDQKLYTYVTSNQCMLAHLTVVTVRTNIRWFGRAHTGRKRPGLLWRVWVVRRIHS